MAILLVIGVMDLRALASWPPPSPSNASPPPARASREPLEPSSSGQGWFGSHARRGSHEA
jgi:hypothetical protein